VVIDVRSKYDETHHTPASFYINHRETQDGQIYALDQKKWLVALVVASFS